MMRKDLITEFVQSRHVVLKISAGVASMMAAGFQFAPIEHKCFNHHNETGTDFGLGEGRTLEHAVTHTLLDRTDSIPRAGEGQPTPFSVRLRLRIINIIHAVVMYFVPTSIRVTADRIQLGSSH